jgi:hypothetical protein
VPAQRGQSETVPDYPYLAESLPALIALKNRRALFAGPLSSLGEAHFRHVSGCLLGTVAGAFTRPVTDSPRRLMRRWRKQQEAGAGMLSYESFFDRFRVTKGCGVDSAGASHLPSLGWSKSEPAASAPHKSNCSGVGSGRCLAAPRGGVGLVRPIGFSGIEGTGGFPGHGQK